MAITPGQIQGKLLSDRLKKAHEKPRYRIIWGFKAISAIVYTDAYQIPNEEKTCACFRVK